MTPEVHNVNSVLHHWTQGDTRLYDTLLEVLNDPGLQSRELVFILQSMRGCVAQLDRTHEVLVGSLMKVNWPNQEEGVIREYRSFLLNLLSAHTFYLRAGLRMLVRHFLPDTSESEPEAETKALEDKKYINIHLVLRAVSSLIPMTWTVLMPLLSNCCPFILRPLYHLECFFTNLLQIPAYMPSLRQPILELIVSKLIQLDVRSPRCEIECTEGDKQEVDQVMFQMEVPSKHQDDNMPDTAEHVGAQKLDVLMELLLKYIHDTSYKKDVCDWDTCKKLYRELLLVFERIVLPTCASSHCQFFMFYICSFKPALADGFIDYLWTRFQNPNSETVFRQTSVAYIGSFISRAKFISIKTLKTCMELMVEWVHRYLEEISAETIFADVSHHAPFYSVCQAIFYVFCFRSKDILDSEKGYKWAAGLQLQRIVTCRLNPLRSCLPLVVETFSSVTRIYQLAFCDTIIEKNKRCTISVSTQNNDGFAVQTEILDSFFPFDPYLLNRSGELVRPLYREYTCGAVSTPHTKQHLQMEDDDFLTETENKVAFGTSGAPMSHFGVSQKPPASTDFLNYGTSPGFKHV
ncbi:RNA polymerase I-specific transcription initiation factor RRN3-like [Haliotis rufescens]|uniref:RNA polymerase I-specific transcription initiation factor RRN3-like n=1 Tax=Haliotis rufescens TaxID=6454 RepID=UPI00201F9212|nr:RNA polymerase I-specific transcription initiation factor RRN3-like [Haliotis rufescens]XP_048258606.1 RNA polymerase I-specific transcription initiation factor RRN3-like [Haliotis rufescens]